MKIFLASDHAGFTHKEALKQWLLTQSEIVAEVVDCGAHLLDEQDDYVDYIAAAAREVTKEPAAHKAIIFGGSGQGEAMAANRFATIRATVYYGGPTAILSLSREHNDANVLSIGARFMSTEACIEACRLWLTSEAVVEERHIRRIKKLSQLP